jgi:hypothetical protein
MNAFIANLDKLRLATGATILVIHHSGKDSSRGERGSSALRAAVDTSIEVTGQSGTRTFRVEKQKDGESGASFSFDLKSVEIGLDDEGESITSCVVEPAAAALTSGRDRAAKLPAQAKNILAALREAIDRQGTVPPASNYIPKNVFAVDLRTFKEMSASRLGSDMEADTKEKAIRRARDRLQEAGIIGVYEDWVWLEKR